MSVSKFDEKELNVVREVPNRRPNAPVLQYYDFPTTPKEAYLSAIRDKKPVWQPTNVEVKLFCPKVFPDNVARAYVLEAEPLPREEFGGKDMFGIEWVYVDVAGGSMVQPGSPLLEDANEWYDKVVWPDVDSWDWEACAELNKDYVNDGSFVVAWIMNGYYERLISFMDFEGAVMAMIDEDQTDAVKDLFEKLTDLYIKIVDKFLEYFPNLGGFCVHDDWAGQTAPFFSPAVCEEMLVPAMRRLTDYMHSKGLIADFHCCGKVELQVPNMIKAGWDSWSGMIMNDTHMLYEKYGDQIAIGVLPESFDPETTSEEEQREYARKHAEKFCNPRKPCLFNGYGAAMLTPAFREELYKQSRLRFSEV